MNREDFPILNERVYGKQLVYLDNAATTQRPQVMLDAMNDAYLHRNANIHRGVHYLSQVATEGHEQARQRLASYLGASSAKEIVFTKGTTDGLNMLAFSFGEYAVQEGDEIIVSASEHHSNIVPWQMLCQRKKAVLRVIPLLDDLIWDMDAVSDLITSRTRLVSVAHVSNALGIVNPIRELIRLAHDRHIPVCIDGAQSAARMAVDVQALDCDFYVCSAHKMYGPTGIGVLYGKEKWLNLLPPAQGGGEMIDHVRFEHTTYNALPYKFEAGTPDFIGSVAFARAVDYIDQIGRDRISEHECHLVRYAEERLSEIGGVHVYAAGQPKAGVLSFNVYKSDGTLIHPFDIGTLLDKQGVAVRTGHHCAEPLMDHLRIPGTVRISFALYNTEQDIDLFIAALHRAVDMLS